MVLYKVIARASAKERNTKYIKYIIIITICSINGKPLFVRDVIYL